MSKNMVVECEIQDRGLLIEVLNDLDIQHESGFGLALYGYAGRLREEKADVVIDRRTISQRHGGAPNDLGFRFRNGKAEMIISEYDAKARAPGRRVADAIMQEYARRRVIARARAKGYEVESIETDAGGNLRVILAPKRRSAARPRAFIRRPA